MTAGVKKGAAQASRLGKALGAMVTGTLVLALETHGALAADTYGAKAPSSAIVNTEVVRSAATQAAGLLSDRISQVVGGGAMFLGENGSAGTGLSAGDAGHPAGFWLSTSNHWLRDSQNGASFNGNIGDVVGGFDYQRPDGLMLGLAFGYENLNVDTTFNNGVLKDGGYGLSPYAGYRFNDIWSADLQLSHVWVNYDESHAGVSGSNSGSRWSFSGNVNANQELPENWLVGSSLGLFYVKEFQTAYIESNGNPVAAATPYTGEIRWKEMLGYRLTVGGVELVPNVSVRLEYDPLQTREAIIDANGDHAATSNFGATFGAGLRGRLNEDTTLTLEGTSEQFRPYMNDYGVSLTLRIER
ncbi:autotransporter beta-domain protein [mine drainage metagenome]|uniref:Autotransporter beta-domain protein n=1 Tax=mine drainage metagenome TaxID=410659 RepID=A0A1J5RH18_9ZZZZ